MTLAPVPEVVFPEVRDEYCFDAHGIISASTARDFERTTFAVR